MVLLVHRQLTMPYVPPCSSIQSPIVVQKGVIEHIESTGKEGSDGQVSYKAASGGDISVERIDTVLGSGAQNTPTLQGTGSGGEFASEDTQGRPTVTTSSTSHEEGSSAPLAQEQEGNPTAPISSTTFTLPIGRLSRAASLSILSTTPPLPLTPMNALVDNFAAASLAGSGLGHSDTVVPTLKNVTLREAEHIQVGGGGGMGEVDMPRLPSEVKVLAVGDEGRDEVGSGVGQGQGGVVEVGVGGAGIMGERKGSHAESETSTSSVPDLVHSRGRTNDNSSTSLDSMDSPLSPDEAGLSMGINNFENGVEGGGGGGDGVVVVGQGEDEDPRVLALNKYKEGLYTYTVRLCLCDWAGKGLDWGGRAGGAWVEVCSLGGRLGRGRCTGDGRAERVGGG